MVSSGLRILASLVVAAFLIAGCTRMTERPPAPEPQSSAVPSASAAPAESVSVDPSSPGPPPTDEGVLPPVPGRPTLDDPSGPVEPSDIGACWPVYHQAEWYAGDQCGPHDFILDAPAVPISPGAPMRIVAPTDWSFSADAVSGAPEIGDHDAWTAMVAPIDALASLPDGQQESISVATGGRLLGSGAGPTEVVTLVAPTEPGEYLLQLNVDLFRDGWTFVGPLYFWRILLSS